MHATSRVISKKADEIDVLVYYQLQQIITEILAWLSVWSEVQMICTGPADATATHIISCSSKIQNGLPFQCWLTQVVLVKRPLNGCSKADYH